MADDLPPEISGDQRQAAMFAAATLAELWNLKDRVSVADLIQRALDATGYDALLLAEFLGERKLANMRKLIDLARDFEGDGSFKLADFILELAGQVSDRPKEALAATHGSDMDVVRLMTIHQSKGLEFPVVVVADLNRQANSQSPSVEFHADWGPLVKLPDDGDETAVGGHELFHLLAAEHDEAESRRLFYVAATRAADYLILSSGLTDLARLQGSWLRMLESRFELETGALRESVDGGAGVRGSSSERPRVLVTMSPPAIVASTPSSQKTAWSELLSAAERSSAQPTANLISPIAARAHERRQFSFSRLSGIVHARRAANTTPMHDSDTDDDSGSVSLDAAIDPIGLGTLAHAVIADLRFPMSPAALESLVRRHSERQGDAASAEADAALTLVERFLQSARAQELAVATIDHVETEFLMAWPSSLAAGGSGEVQITGFIDRLYRSPAGDWTLLDFKTNRVAPGTLESIAAGYELQMLVYAAAAERVLGKPPRELALHFLRTGEERHFPWNSAARSRLADLLDAALSTAMAR